MIKINRASSEELGPWNELLSRLTEAIRAYRQLYIDYVNSWLAEHIKSQQASVGLSYQFDSKPISDLLAQEIKTAQNLFGAHRDELVISFDDFSARRFASRGQARLTVGHLKAAEADYLGQKTGNDVTVLLDDTMSELDAKNTTRLLDLFSKKHQLVLTAAEKLDLGGEWSKIEL
jgi:recombinational DNA repair ATPase RecF